MKITLEYVATLKLSGPSSGDEIDIPDGMTITELFSQLGIRAMHQRVLIPFINEKKVHRDTTLREGDHLFIGMPVGGG